MITCSKKRTHKIYTGLIDIYSIEITLILQFFFISIVNNTGIMSTPAASVILDKDRRFPSMLYSMLENAEQQGYSNIISWLPVGNNDGHQCCYFKVHNSKAFTDMVMKSYFAQTHYKSFLRQLNLYCFIRNTNRSSPFYGAYSHMFFVRGQSEWCQFITRVKNKNSPRKYAPLDEKLKLPTFSRPSSQMACTEQSECDSNVSQHTADLTIESCMMMTQRVDKDVMGMFPPNLQEDLVLPIAQESTPKMLDQASRNLLPDNTNSPSSRLLYEPIPIVIISNEMVSPAWSRNMMMDVQKDIIDIFGSQNGW